jgi:hypothetical protein
LKRTRVTGFDGGANPTIETQRKVTLMLQSNEKRLLDVPSGIA